MTSPQFIFFFEQGMTQQKIRDYQRTFQRQEYYSRQEPCYENCCTEEHAYRCCPGQIDIWFLPRPVGIKEEELPRTVEILSRLRSLAYKTYECIVPIVVSDATLQSWGAVWDWLSTSQKRPPNVPPLIHWLNNSFDVVIQFEVSYGANLRPVLRKEDMPPLEKCIVILLLILNPDTQSEATREQILHETISAVLKDLGIVRGIVLLATVHPNSFAWDVSYPDLLKLGQEIGVLIWTLSVPQPFEILAEVADAVKAKLHSTLYDAIQQLQLLGFLSNWIL